MMPAATLAGSTSSPTYESDDKGNARWSHWKPERPLQRTEQTVERTFHSGAVLLCCTKQKQGYSRRELRNDHYQRLVMGKSESPRRNPSRPVPLPRHFDSGWVQTTPL